MQLRVLCFGLLQEWKVGVRVFPNGEEVLIGGSGARGIACQDQRTRQFELADGVSGLRGKDVLRSINSRNSAAASFPDFIERYASPR